ncbi:hypothetical protein BE17_47535 [Sorangium cellulosum]|uniref:Uncharacterized protein n=1 Tax=Sorangium cellulosum TaxID=56 RepID=A0A150SRE6_SORCE|nr:hypothetical protein BE17_47535 [Sorangium cellulosum]
MRGNLRTILTTGRRVRKLVTSLDEIADRVVLLDETKIREEHGKLWKGLTERDLHRGAFCIFGGVKNQGRDKSLPHFERDDGAWFDFSITVREADGIVELLAYDFEIRMAPSMGASFLRFDLNLPDHRNQARELRCHLHPGSDDLLVPAPLMSPIELCTLFVYGARLPADRKSRAPTSFDVGWLQQTLERVSPAAGRPIA